jgi:hypothetical protein
MLHKADRKKSPNSGGRGIEETGSFWALARITPMTEMGRIDPSPDVLFGRDAISELLTVRLPFSN